MKKAVFINSSFLAYAKNLEKLQTGNTKLGCYRDKWSSREDLRILYFEVKIGENIKYIVSLSNPLHFISLRGKLGLCKVGSLPKSANSKNTLYI